MTERGAAEGCFSKYQALVEARQRLADDIQRTLPDAFADAARAFFEKNPSINSFSWAQYTDYFNDGDTCYFHVHSDDVSINSYCDDDDEVSDEAYDAVHRFLKQFDTEDFETLFGDHVRVSVCRDGAIDTEGHYHD